MVRFRLKPQQPLQFLDLLGVLSSTSPKPISGRFYILRNIVWCFTFCNLIFQLIGEALYIYQNPHDIIKILIIILMAACVTDGALNLIICYIQRDKFQYLLAKIEIYLETANKNDLNVLQKHVNRYAVLLVTNTLFFSVTGLIIYVRPLFTEERFPVDVWYPFNVDTPFRTFLIYVSQVLATTKCVCYGFSTDLTISMLFCYATTRLEILQHNLEKTKSKNFIRACIKEHQNIIKFVELIQTTIQYSILKLNVTMGTAIVCSLFPLIINLPLAVKGQFFFLFLSSCERFYISAWSANDLSEMSIRIGNNFSIEDYMTPETVNNILFILLRSQKPLTISMARFLPVLSVEYFGNFITKAFSYFTAMKSMMDI